MTETPGHEHDCDGCVFLGRWFSSDLYYCEQRAHGIPTVIARHSSQDPDYTSGLVLEHMVPALAVAADRARWRGLISDAEKGATQGRNDNVVSQQRT